MKKKAKFKVLMKKNDQKFMPLMKNTVKSNILMKKAKKKFKVLTQIYLCPRVL